MEPTTTTAGLAHAVAGALARKLLDVLARFVSDKHQNTEETVTPNLEATFNEVLNWSERIEYYGLGHALNTDNSSIQLHISSLPRRFSRGNQKLDWDEEKILRSQAHLLLLGDPGAGKSTTLKRLIRRLLLDESSHPRDSSQYPVLVRLRRQNLDLSLSQWIAIALGIAWTEEWIPAQIDGEDRAPVKRRVHHRVGNRELSNVVVALLEETQPLVCIDGMDELPRDRRKRLEAELTILAAGLRSCKLIVTTRSGDYTRNIEGFDVIELLPLSNEQIDAIAQHVIGDPSDFLAQVRRLPNEDALHRPVALMQLLALYRARGALPDQPSATSRKLAALYLEEWNTLNGISRESQYANFPPERQLDFLSAVAYHLFYRTSGQTLSFPTETLEKIYLDIHMTFGLPIGEATKVAQEIETHTGIVVKVGGDHHEFSHASMQEFLAAHYIVRNPFSSELFDCIRQAPASVAIAIVLASDPVNWLVSIFLHIDNHARVHKLEHKISEFLRRLRLERPFFYVNGALGFALVHVANVFSDRADVLTELEGLMSAVEVRESVNTALQAYDIIIINDTNRLVALQLRERPQLDRFHSVSNSVHVPRDWVQRAPVAVKPTGDE